MGSAADPLTLVSGWPCSIRLQSFTASGSVFNIQSLPETIWQVTNCHFLKTVMTVTR
jgi:hypothetical protein